MHADKPMTDRVCWTRLISLGRVTLAQARAMYTIDKGNKGFLSSLLSQ
jgi:hypothetical protein